jgi:hypothetical protein
MKKPRNNYINNKKMQEAFRDHREKVRLAKEKGLPEPPLSNYIGECFMLIANNLAKRGNFSGYSYIDEMKDDGIENCIIGAHNYDPDKGDNPLAYFTQTIWFAFLRRIEKEKIQSYVKYKLLQNMHINGELTDGNSEDFKSLDIKVDNEFADQIVTDFEEKKRKKDIKYKNNKKKKGVEEYFSNDVEDAND